jgi:hypothetical protein
MTPSIQNFAVLLIIGVCLAYIVYQSIQAFRGRKSKLGSCCSKGCSATTPTADPSPKPAPVQFLPLANVGRRTHK